MVFNVRAGSSSSVVRWDGTHMIDVSIERAVPFSEFALLPVR